MEKIDYKKQLKHLYGPSAQKVEVVDVPEMNFLMVDGEGNPNTSQSFSDAIEALYSVSYKKRGPQAGPRVMEGSEVFSEL